MKLFILTKKILLILLIQLLLASGFAIVTPNIFRVLATDNGTLSISFNPAGGVLTQTSVGTGRKEFSAITLSAVFSQAATASGSLAINSCWRVTSDSNNLRIINPSITAEAQAAGFVLGLCTEPYTCGNDVRICYDSNSFNINAAKTITLGSFQLGQASISTPVPSSVNLTNTRSNFKDGTMSAPSPSYTFETSEETASYTSPVTWPTSKNLNDSFTYHWQVANSKTTATYISRYSLDGGAMTDIGTAITGTGGTIGREETLVLSRGGTYRFQIFKVGTVASLTPTAKSFVVIDPANIHLVFTADNQFKGTKADPYFTVNVNYSSGANLVSRFKVCMKWDSSKFWFACSSAVSANGAVARIDNVNDGAGNEYACWIQKDGYTPVQFANTNIGSVKLHLRNASLATAALSTQVRFDTGYTDIYWTVGGVETRHNEGISGPTTFNISAISTGAPAGTSPQCGNPTNTPTPTEGTTGTPTLTPTVTPTGVPCPRGDSGNLDCSPNEIIDAVDLNILLTSWGPVPTPAPGKHLADIAPTPLDQKVDILDLNKLLINWGSGGGTPTGTGSPTPTPTNPPSAYPHPPAANYVFYEWQNADLNAQHPNGAPWGKVFVVRWDSVQGGLNSFNWQGIDAYLARAATLNTPVMISFSPYEWTTDRSNIPTNILDQHPCEDGTRPYSLGTDLTPSFIKNAIGLKYAYMKKAGNQFCVPVPNPNNYSCTLVGIPPYDDGMYKQAIKNLAAAMGQKYNNDPKVAGIMIGWGADAEFGNVLGNWGDCDSEQSAIQQTGFNMSQYLALMTAAGVNNDAGDWFGAAFPNKPVYVRVTGAGKERVPVAMPDWPVNVGLAQASLTPDHNWFSDSAGQGIMDIAMLAAGRRPVEWENAHAGGFTSSKQYAYGLFLAMLPTFPDFFDFTGVGCFDSNILPTCNWAKQYYGKAPATTNEVWIAFQQTAYNMPQPCSSAKCFGGWARDWEYGLKLTSAKGTTINKAGLVELFNQAVADNYSGQARKILPNNTIILKPVDGWKGLLTGSSYEISLIYVGGAGKVKIEVGDDTNGYETQEFDKETGTQWYTKALTFTKRPVKIKITPSIDTLYTHMVKVKLN